VKTFFSPNISQLHDPFLIKNLDKVENRIIKNYVFEMKGQDNIQLNAKKIRLSHPETDQL
jgi:hypothetical protein